MAARTKLKRKSYLVDGARFAAPRKLWASKLMRR